MMLGIMKGLVMTPVIPKSRAPVAARKTERQTRYAARTARETPTGVVRKSAQSGTPLRGRVGRSTGVGIDQHDADHAVGNIIEAIQQIALALDGAAVALMFYLPAKGSESSEAVRRLGRAQERFARAVHLFDGINRPMSNNRSAGFAH
jgi:hypothetical protein